MYELHYSKRFVKMAQNIPVRIQSKLAQSLMTLQNNPFENQLHTKKLKGIEPDEFSFRITRDYRVTFAFEDSRHINLLTVDHRKDVYR